MSLACCSKLLLARQPCLVAQLSFRARLASHTGSAAAYSDLSKVRRKAVALNPIAPLHCALISFSS